MTVFEALSVAYGPIPTGSAVYLCTATGPSFKGIREDLGTPCWVSPGGALGHAPREAAQAKEPWADEALAKMVAEMGVLGPDCWLRSDERFSEHLPRVFVFPGFIAFPSGPDIGGRPAESFAGLLGDRYDAVLAAARGVLSSDACKA